MGIIYSVLFLGILLATEPVKQDLSYHLLADKRQWFFIPNFLDVVSNLFFIIIGVAGLLLAEKEGSEISLSWRVFFFGLILVALGSMYYHWSPDNKSLVWDRLPMTISFMGLFVALFIENTAINVAEKNLLIMAVLLGLSSVVYWHFTDDLRFYGFVQFGTLTAIPLILYLYKNKDRQSRYLLYGLGFYILAKVFEWADSFIFEQTGQMFSGHTIKHVTAAAATYCVYLMLKKRQKV
ncbi:MAG: ceramidase domain-containing protein [Methylococcales bacterium]|nr:ceramidase domain-containing protein [Methylococcales bacterium]